MISFVYTTRTSQPCYAHLRGVTAAPDSNTDVNVGEPGGAQQEHGLERLHAKNGRLQQLDGATVHLDQPASALAVSHGRGGLLLKEIGAGGGGKHAK